MHGESGNYGATSLLVLASVGQCWLVLSVGYAAFLMVNAMGNHGGFN